MATPRKTYTKIVGIDEAGRGPLAGPVAVGIAVVPRGFDWRLLPRVDDSKKLNAKDREAVFRVAHTLRREGIIDFTVSLVGHETIDRQGISWAVVLGITRGLRRLSLNPKSVHILLDGLLHAPPEYTQQETVIHGDAQEKVIGLASILAKVTRDRRMVRLGKRYPGYGIEVHMGYGTLAHRNAIRKLGISPIHRATFCTRFTRKR